MTQYIDKSVLVAEIDKAIDSPAPSHDQQCDWEDGYYGGLYKAESIIDTLEVKEVDSDDAVSATIDFPLIGYDFPNIYPNYKELKEYCIRHCIKDNDKVKITIVKEK
jgi:hypothetical protein